MKNLLVGLVCFLSILTTAKAQYFTPINNYQQPLGLSVVKYFGIPYGTTPTLNVTRTYPGALFFNTTDSSLYVWSGTQWQKNGSASGSGNTYIDSLINIYNYYTNIQSSRNKLISGALIHRDSLTFYTTNLVYQINDSIYTSLPDSITLPDADPTNTKYVAVYVDAAGGLGYIVGPTPPAAIPGVDEDTQLLLGTFEIKPNAVAPEGLANYNVYKELDDRWAILNRGTISTGYDSAYTTSPYGGSTYSLLIPAVVNGQYFEFEDGQDYDAADLSYLSWQLRLRATFANNCRITISLWYGNSQVSVGGVQLVTGAFGFDRTVINQYQLNGIPMSAWTFITGSAGVFNKIRITLSGTNASGFQIDNFRLQAGGTNTGTITGVTTFNSRDGNVMPLKADYGRWFVDSAGINADTSLYMYYASGTYLFSLPTLRTITIPGYLMDFDSIGPITTKVGVDSVALAALLAGAGGGSGGDSIVSILKNATRDSVITTMYDGRRFAVKDSIGTGGGTITVLDSVPVWTKKGVVLYANDAQGVGTGEPSVLWDSDPQIITDVDSVFKMWYGVGFGNDTLDINYAESTDGIAWVPRSASVITNHLRGFVNKISGVYYAFAVDSTETKLDRFTSTDGVTFTLTHSNVLGANSWGIGYYNTSFIDDGGGVWKMLVEGLVLPNYIFNVGYYSSNDLGITWTQPVTNPVLGDDTHEAAGPFLKKISGQYYAWVQGIGGTVLPTDLYRYSSSDMQTWVLETTSPALARTMDDEGVGSDEGQVADIHIVQKGSTLFGFYSGLKYGLTGIGSRIKLVTAPMTFERLVLTKEGNGLEVEAVSNLSVNNTPIQNSTLGKLLYTGANKQLAETDSLTYTRSTGNLVSTGKIGIGNSTPVRQLDILKGTNGSVGISVKNSTDGSAAIAIYDATNISNKTVSMGMTAVSYSPLGALTGNNGFLYSVDDLSVISNGGIIKFASAGMTEKWRMDASGNFTNRLATAAHKISLTSAVAAPDLINIRNTSALAGAMAAYQFENNLATSGSFGVTGGGYTPFGILANNTTFLYAASDVSLMAFGSGKKIRFSAGDQNEAANVSVDGFTSKKFYVSALNTAPASASATGTTGEIRITATYIYVCTATNTWVRTALTTW